MGTVERGSRGVPVSERIYKLLSFFIALMVLGFGLACVGPGPNGDDDGDDGNGDSSSEGEVSCAEAQGVTDLTATDGTVSLTDPMTDQVFDITVSTDSDIPLASMQVLLFSNGADYFIVAFDPDGFYGVDSSGGPLSAASGDGFLSPRMAYAQDPITVSFVLEAVPIGTKLLSFPGTPPNLVDRRWCGIGSFSETCLTAEQLATRLDLALFFDPEANKIWLALEEAISENFVESGLTSGYTGGRTFNTFTIAGFPAIVVPGDACTPGDVTSDDIRISLWWDNNADIDLHVIDPNGEEIYWADTTSASGGELDFDAMCASFPEGSRGGPEHVTWGPGEAISGEYNVDVNYFSECYGEGETRFSITIYVSGSRIFETTDAIINPGDGRIDVTTFNY